MSKVELRHQIENLFDQGVSINKMAELLNITEKTVKRNLPLEKLKEKIYNLIEQGYSYTKIGKVLSLGSNTISNYAQGSEAEKKVINTIVIRFKKGESLNIILNDYSMSKQGILRFIPDEIRFERLEDLYIKQQLPFSEICKALGISRSTLKNWINESGLSHRFHIDDKFVKRYPEEEIVRDYFKLKSIETIAKENGVHKNKVSNILKKWGIKKYRDLNNIRRHVNGNFLIKISKQFDEIVIGELLGDFAIAPPSIKPKKGFTQRYTSSINFLNDYNFNNFKNLNPKEFANSINIIKSTPIARLALTCSILEAPWLYSLYNIFLRQNLNPNLTIIKNRSNNSYQLNLTSAKFVQIANYHAKWYPKGIKVVPRDLRLTPLVLLHWYIGDGSFNNSISLFTNGFTKKDVLFLIKKMDCTVGIKTKFNMTKTGPIIKIYKKIEIEKFFKVLDLAGEETNFCRRFFPWKFEKVTKNEVMISNEYKELVKTYLFEKNKEMYKRVLEYIENY